MPYRPNIVNELNILLKFNQHSTHEGIKVHDEAGQESVNATKRLFSKGLITRNDGGYLTDRGIELAEQANGLISALDVTS